jgi:hypothetical protein
MKDTGANSAAGPSSGAYPERDNAWGSSQIDTCMHLLAGADLPGSMADLAAKTRASPSVYMPSLAEFSQ